MSESLEEFIQDLPELDPVVVKLLYQRGLRSQEEVDAFLHPEYVRDQHDSFLFKDMKKAVERIIAARDNAEKIVIYGDYDADGVCSSVLLLSALQQIGIKENVRIYLPHRDTEGYGLNTAAIDTFIGEGVDLIITVDCGISNADEVQLATDNNIDVIVTDHHVEPLRLPESAYAIINPQISSDTYPFPMLAGVGVAFKLTQALGKTLDLGESFEKWLLDLVAISTITDCMPLVDENRTLVKYGLVVLNKTRRLGLKTLIASTHKLGTPVTTTSIGYRIGPWINAAGRIDHANVAVQALVEEDPAKVDAQVEKLKRTNIDRQQQTEVMYQEARQQAEAQKNDPVIYVFGKHWPLGLVGLVAGRLVSAYGKPAFVLTENDTEVSGSGRSIEGLDMISNLQKIEDLFYKYGGHAMACGFTLKKDHSREKFADTFTNIAKYALSKIDHSMNVVVDADLEVSDINWELVQQLDQFNPFGQGNPEPIFRIRNSKIKDFQVIGPKRNHLRLVLTDEKKSVKAIAFGQADFANRLSIGDDVEATCNLGINHWNGNSEIQVMIKDIKKKNSIHD
ncbi:MAG: single-stranded-DNA-specific exonuclease RecJ [bacterium]|nr:single-stranded-DNA-specific exonuclease RecJ [bacterium]